LTAEEISVVQSSKDVCLQAQNQFKQPFKIQLLGSMCVGKSSITRIITESNHVNVSATYDEQPHVWTYHVHSKDKEKLKDVLPQTDDLTKIVYSTAPLLENTIVIDTPGFGAIKGLARDDELWSRIHEADLYLLVEEAKYMQKKDIDLVKEKLGENKFYIVILSQTDLILNVDLDTNEKKIVTILKEAEKRFVDVPYLPLSSELYRKNPELCPNFQLLIDFLIGHDGDSRDLWTLKIGNLLQIDLEQLGLCQRIIADVCQKIESDVSLLEECKNSLNIKLKELYEKGFNVITLKDCCATQSTEAHLAATEGTFNMFSTPMSAEDFAKMIASK